MSLGYLIINCCLAVLDVSGIDNSLAIIAFKVLRGNDFKVVM